MDGCRGVTGEERNDVCDITGLDEAARCGRTHDQVVVRVIRRAELFELRREHAARTYCVDPQAIRRVLHRQGTGKPNQPMLGSAVTSRVSLALDPGYGGDV